VQAIIALSVLTSAARAQIGQPVPQLPPARRSRLSAAAIEARAHKAAALCVAREAERAAARAAAAEHASRVRWERDEELRAERELRRFLRSLPPQAARLTPPQAVQAQLCYALPQAAPPVCAAERAVCEPQDDLPVCEPKADCRRGILEVHGECLFAQPEAEEWRAQAGEQAALGDETQQSQLAAWSHGLAAVGRPSHATTLRGRATCGAPRVDYAELAELDGSAFQPKDFDLKAAKAARRSQE